MANKSNQELIHDAQAQAQQAVNDAYDLTPEAFRRFIVRLPQSKVVKRGRSRNENVYASIEVPYMGVDGKVKMARVAHEAAGKGLDIETEIVTIGDLWFIRAVVISEMLGKAIGHAPINFGGAGVDGSNPVENGETSAVGRALSFLGYGLFGTGIASADEMENYLARDAGSAKPYTIPEEKRQELTRKLRDLGRSDEEIEAGLAKLTSAAKVEQTIEKVSRDWEAKAQKAGGAINWDVDHESEAEPPAAEAKPFTYEKKRWNAIFDTMERVGIARADFEVYVLLDHSRAGGNARSIDSLDDSVMFQYQQLTANEQKAKEFADVVLKTLAKAKQRSAS